MILGLADFHFPDHVARLYPENPQGEWALEIGFGDGRFWATQGKEEPQLNYLGVELSGVSLLKAWRRLKATNLPNAHLTRMPANTLLRGVIPTGSLARIIVNFPDPWPKEEHHENRLLRQPFFALAANRLRQGGEIWFTTDHAEYFDFALKEAALSGFFEAYQELPPTAALQTKYALKWRELGLKANFVRWKVTSRPEIPHLEVGEGALSMPHAIVQLPPAFELNNFEKFVLRQPEQPEQTVVLLEAYQHTTRNEWIVLCHVEEQDLIQEAIVSINLREEDALVRLERFGGVIITPGLKAAVHAVTNFLELRGATVVRRTY